MNPRPSVVIERCFGLWWLELHKRGTGDGIGTVEDRGFTLTLRGARRRARRILRKKPPHREVLTAEQLQVVEGGKAS